jgi:outer membrane protein TolC
MKRVNRIAIAGVFLAGVATFAQNANGPLALRTDAVDLSATKSSEGAAEPSREPMTLKTAVGLALKHSTTLAIAQADEQKAQKGVAESRYMFLPQVTVGSGLGYSDGFPLSLENLAPSLLNVNSSAYIW